MKFTKSSLARLWFITLETICVLTLFAIVGPGRGASDSLWTLLLCASSLLLVTSALMITSEKRLAVIGLITGVIGLIVGLFAPHLIE